MMLRVEGLFDAAVAAYARAIDSGVSDPHEAWLNRGVIEADDRLDRAAAIDCFKTAIALRPDALPAYINLGNMYEEYGDFAAAVKIYRAAVAACSPSEAALARIGFCETVTTIDDPLIKTIHTASRAANVSPLDRESLLFALGGIYDGLGEYHKAWDTYRAANDHANTYMLAYDRTAEAARFDAIKSAFPVSIFGGNDDELHRDITTPRPIFICGMFRSGSTLFEQIISGSPDVTPCGEIGFFDSLIRRPDFILPSGRGIDPRTLATWEADYRNDARISAVTTPYFIDKRPDNVLYLGIIKHMFPQAKIVITKCAPRDNALSLYFTQFGAGQSYARDLDDIAHYQALHENLITHWQRCFNKDIIIADYDRFVRDPETQGRIILGGLGLEFSPECLDVHTRTNRVKTASYHQVRQKLYKGSSGRAAHYDFAFKA